MLSGCPAAAPPPSRLFHKTPSSYDNRAGSLPAGKLRLTIQSAPPRAVCGFPHGWSVKNKVSPITPHKRCSYSQEMITSQLCWHFHGHGNMSANKREGDQWDLQLSICCLGSPDALVLPLTNQKGGRDYYWLLYCVIVVCSPITHESVIVRLLFILL